MVKKRDSTYRTAIVVGIALLITLLITLLAYLGFLRSPLETVRSDGTAAATLPTKATSAAATVVAPLQPVIPTAAKIFYGDTWTWPYQPARLAHLTRGKFYVPLQDENRIAILDPDAPDYGLKLIETKFAQPHHPWTAPGMRYSWISFQSENKGDHDAIAVLDTWQDEIIKTIHTGTNDPFHMAFSPTENILVAADFDSIAGRVHLFDTVAMTQIAAIETTGLATRDVLITHDGRYAFIGHQGYDPARGILGAVDLLDIANRKVLKSFGEGRCRSGKMTYDGTLVFFSCDRSDQILVIDVAAQQEITRIPLPADSGPFNLAFRPDDRFAYVGLKDAGQLGIIDVETLELVKTLASGTETNSTYLHPYAPLAVTTNDGTDAHVTIINTETNEIVGLIDTDGRGTHNGQWSADGRWFLVSNRLGDSVTLLGYAKATNSIAWIDDIAVGFGANGVQWVPYFCGVPELTQANVQDVMNVLPINAQGDCGE